MATRTVRRPARDRLTEARRQLNTERNCLRVHTQVCAACAHGRDPGRDWCDEGWAMAKEIARYTTRIRMLEDEIELAGRQGVLW